MPASSKVRIVEECAGRFREIPSHKQVQYLCWVRQQMRRLSRKSLRKPQQRREKRSISLMIKLWTKFWAFLQPASHTKKLFFPVDDFLIKKYSWIPARAAHPWWSSWGQIRPLCPAADTVHISSLFYTYSCTAVPLKRLLRFPCSFNWVRIIEETTDWKPWIQFPRAKYFN